MLRSAGGAGSSRSGSPTVGIAVADGSGGTGVGRAPGREAAADEGLRALSHHRAGARRDNAVSGVAACRCSSGKAEHWVHRFNDSGFATFEKQPNHPGRPIIVDGQQVRALIRVALSRPEDLGLPFTQWSVAKLKAYCLQQDLIPPITDEWVRRLLRGKASPTSTPRPGSSQRTLSTRSKNRLFDLYERCPEGAAVVCFDECGPLELRPLAGRGWARVGHPRAFGPPTAGSRVPNNCWPSTMSTPIVSSARCASARPLPISSRCSQGCEPAIHSTSGSTW